MSKTSKLLKLNILLITVVVLTTNLARAEVGLEFDRNGHIKRPDDIILIRGVKNEKKDKLKKAMRDYKLSAEFGNNKAMFFISLLHFQEKKWDHAYAWLRLMTEEFGDSRKLILDVKLLLQQSELLRSNKILSKLRLKYNKEFFFKRRERWNKSIKITGTHVRGLELVHDVDIYYGGSNNLNIVNLDMARKEMKNYIYDYKSVETKIIMGEIIPVED